MNNETKAKEVAYCWFESKFKEGAPVAKDVFLYDRELWDSMQTQLVTAGENPTHDDVKELVRRMDKGGWLGGIAEGRTFDEQRTIIVDRQNNWRNTGHAEGTEGIAADLTRYAGAMREPKLAEYYATQHWINRSRQHRATCNWTCQLCLKRHPENSGSLVTHHRSYKKEGGECALYNESSRELMALCASPCHQLADIARYICVGRITAEDLEISLRPLFASVR